MKDPAFRLNCPLTIAVTRSEEAVLRCLAAERGMSLSAYTREVLRSFLRYVLRDDIAAAERAEAEAAARV